MPNVANLAVLMLLCVSRKWATRQSEYVKIIYFVSIDLRTSDRQHVFLLSNALSVQTNGRVCICMDATSAETTTINDAHHINKTDMWHYLVDRGTPERSAPKISKFGVSHLVYVECVNVCKWTDQLTQEHRQHHRSHCVCTSSTDFRYTHMRSCVFVRHTRSQVICVVSVEWNIWFYSYVSRVCHLEHPTQWMINSTATRWSWVFGFCFSCITEHTYTHIRPRINRLVTFDKPTHSLAAIIYLFYLYVFIA